MEHLSHIQQNKSTLDARWAILKQIREIFWSQSFIEVETPYLLPLAGQEPYLSPMALNIHNELGQSFRGYLHTSPEYSMKKLLAAGYEKIFFLGKTFRDYESFGDMHNPEFTMIEWYRVGSDVYGLMDDVEKLISSLRKEAHIERISMKQLWVDTIQCDLDMYTTVEAMRALCIERGYTPAETESYEDVFYRIFLNEIEPTLASRDVVMIHHYPAPMASLSRISAEDPRYAERVEVYARGKELANGFSELTNAQEQLRRLQQEQALRNTLGKEVYAVDMEFIDAVGKLPNCAGIALGIDRLVQYLLEVKNLDALLPLPASQLWNTTHEVDK